MIMPRVVEWQVPPYERGPAHVQGWVNELIQNGDKWLKGLKPFSKITEDVRVLMGTGADLSIGSNELQSDIRTFVETISDLRQIATYGGADQFRKNVETYNNVTKHIFVDSGFVAANRKALQYATIGRGYLWPHFQRTDYGWGKGKMVFDACGPLEVIPEQLPASNKIGESYAVSLLRPMPIAEAHARFWWAQEKIKTLARFDWKSYGTVSTANLLDFWDRWRFGETQSDWDQRYTLMRYTWVRDLRRNTGDYRMQMGPKDASWAYEVPYENELLVFNNPFNNLPQSRRALPEDCRMYPQLRLIITNPTMNETIYDGPAFDQHGMIPITSIDVNDWVWSPVGYSIVRLVSSMERARRGLVDKMGLVTNVNLDPPMGYDLHAGVKRDQTEKLNMLRSSGFRMGVNGDPKKALVSMLPESMRVEEAHFKQLHEYDGRIKSALGLSDLASLRDLKMNISSDSFDKVLENLGPISKGIALNIAESNGNIAQMLKFSIPQYFTTEELMSMVGMGGVSIETFDYKPNDLLPSHLPGEHPQKESAFSRRQRALWFADRVKVISTPSQLLNVTQQQERMLYMLFLQKGVPGISMSTIMEKLGVKNYGTVEGDTEYEKWKFEQVRDAKLKVEMQVMIAGILKDHGIEPPQGGDHPGRGKGGGRPHSNAEPPKAEMRGSQGGDPRAIVSTSK